MDRKYIGSVKPERVVLYGEDVRKNIPPQETLMPENEPIISFTQPDGTGFGLNMNQLSKGLLLVGETGCGKTTAINHCAESIFRIMGEQDICIILDVKGEFADRYFDPKNDNHIIFCGTGPFAKYSSAWNIYGEVYAAAAAESESGDPSDPMLDTHCYDISKDVFHGRAGTAQPFFSEAAQTLFAAVLADHIKTAKNKNDYSNLNNKGLLQFFRNATPQTYGDLITRYPQLRNYLGERDNPQSLGVLGSLVSAVQNSFVGPFAMGIGPRTSFTITDFMENRGGKVLFVEMDLALAESLAPMYRILFDCVLKSVLSMRNQGKGNVWLLFDELSTISENKLLPVAMNLARSKGMKCIAALQSVSQLQTKNSEADAASILEGFTNLVAFRNNDKTTREAIGRRGGTTYEHLSFRAGGSYVELQRPGNAIEDWDILSLTTGEAYIMLTGYKPFRFQFPCYT